MGCNWVFTVHSRAKYLNFMKFFVTNFYLTFHQKNEEFPTNFKPHDFFMIQESSNLNCVHENSMFNLPSNFKSFHITNWLRKSNESSYPHSWKNLIFHLVRYLLVPTFGNDYFHQFNQFSAKRQNWEFGTQLLLCTSFSVCV